MKQKNLYKIAQVIFWSLLFLFSIYHFGHFEQRFGEATILTCLLMPLVMITAYFIVKHLIPHYLLKDQLWYFFLYLFYTFIASIYGIVIILYTSLAWMAGYSYYKLLAPIQSFYSFVGTTYFFILLFVTISVTEQWHTMQRKYLLALQGKSEAELMFLKTQLHPHFLFNTLNNLYYLTLQKSDKAPEVVMKLSHLLDYVLHQGKETWVNLEVEWEKMQDFAYLESMRYHDKLELTMEANISLALYQVPPLLLITFLENCFKHGVKNARDKAFIIVRIEIEKQQILIYIKNSKAIASQNAKSLGIGLENIRKQLDYLYNNQYQLHLKDYSDSFTVYLTLPAHEQH
ncbi:sensor histidine kinase [Flexithrix dorotheae]|uniref:sensor histidine kinase n=1 Tax=Flexithrix dorotheae TaxID=70993 RepID=UPI0012F974F8|nr:histidine kinase [Flexithrix dorotheae]